MSLPEIKNIAIIGAGPTGAGLTKALLKESAFSKIKVFEKRPHFGGLWNYSKPLIHRAQEQSSKFVQCVPLENPFHRIEPVKITTVDKQQHLFDSAVYQNLDANVPKTLMEYNNVPFPEDTPLFPRKESILQYLNDFAKPIEPYVQFDTEVVDLQYDEVSKKYKVGTLNYPFEMAKDSSNVTYDPQEYDAVAISAGIYDLPFIPKKSGLEKWFEVYPESILHSKNYDSERQFCNVTGEILIVGNSASGNDLAYQLANATHRKIYKSKRSETALPAGQSDLIVEVGDISLMNVADRSISFTDGFVLRNVEKVIFCTGFLKSFPFLPKNKESKLSQFITDGKMVHNLYNHILPIDLPTLAFIGLPKYSLPTRLSETQGAWLARVWSKKIALPDKTVQWDYNKWFLEQNKTEAKYHEINFPLDVQYSQRLNKEIEKAGNTDGYFGIEWTSDQIQLRSSIKSLKESYIRYLEDTGKLASSVEELMDSGYFEWPKDVVSSVVVSSFAP